MIHRTSTRRPSAPVDPQFIDRWSPRAFSQRPVKREQLRSLFEAARWAPSCYNEQPWLFLYASKKDDLAYFRTLLTDTNRIWADRAPVLAFLFCRIRFIRTNRINRHAAFDAGAAWLSLALQARKLGLYAHAMAGIHRQEVYDKLRVPSDTFKVICAIAIGYHADPSVLPPDVAIRERPSHRKPPSEFVIEGLFLRADNAEHRK